MTNDHAMHKAHRAHAVAHVVHVDLPVVSRQTAIESIHDKKYIQGNHRTGRSGLFEQRRSLCQAGGGSPHRPRRAPQQRLGRGDRARRGHDALGASRSVMEHAHVGERPILFGRPWQLVGVCDEGGGADRCTAPLSRRVTTGGM